MAATSTAIPKDRGSSPCPSTAIRGKKRPAKFIAPGLRTWATGFVSLTPAEQDKKLTAIEKSRFFQLLRTHTIEGTFCDPMHGGNAGLIGWQLIGFPGPQMNYRNDIDSHYGTAFRPKPASLQQITKRVPIPWEDEKDSGPA